LPIWIGFMEQALKGVPESWPEAPEGLITITANDPSSGKAGKDLVYQESLPPAPEEAPASEVQQPPAPVVDAKPKAVEKIAPQNPAMPGEKRN
jgi:penicillin-binding protein 1A